MAAARARGARADTVAAPREADQPLSPGERGRGEGASDPAALRTTPADPGAPDQAALDAALDLLSPELLDAQGRALVGQILDTVERLGPQAALADLGALWRGMDDAALAERLARVQFVAGLIGRDAAARP